MATRGTVIVPQSRIDTDDHLNDAEWRGVGCTDACKRIRAYIPGEPSIRYVVLHDPESHEVYGMGLSQPGRYRGKIVWTGGLTIDPQRCEIKVNGSPVRLSGLETRTLVYLAEHLDVLLDREHIIQATWGDESHMLSGQDAQQVTQMLRSHIARIRRHIHPCGDLLVSGHGIGYRLRSEPATNAYGADKPPVPWARFHAACIDCQTTEYSYGKRGRCTRCLWRYQQQQKGVS